MRLQYLCGLVAVLAFAGLVYGDGCYIPDRAIKKIPSIPAQRALLAWKDGTETLVISSALDSEAQKLGWIIPLPSTPKTIEKDTPGGLRTLDLCIQPEIIHELPGELALSIWCVLIANILMGTFLFKRQSFIGVLLFVFVFFVLLPCLMMPAAVGSRALATAGKARVEKSVVAGSYEISVLSASHPGELNTWLAENGFASLPAEGDKMITDYIAQGWVFAAVKLTRAESGTNAPHPLKMVFDSKEAVYPLRLTALAGGNTFFEIFVVGDETASCDMLEKAFCGEFFRKERDTKYDEVKYETNVYFVDKLHQSIAHPAVCSLIWDGCVISKFSGNIDAVNMDRDIKFSWMPFVPFQQHFYTAKGAKTSAVILFIVLAGGWLFFSMIVCHKMIIQPRGLQRYSVKVILPAFVLFTVASGVLYACLPKLNESEVQISRGFRFRLPFELFLINEIEGILEKHPEIIQGTGVEIADRLLKELQEMPDRKEYRAEAITGDELKIEDSPGNFTVEKLPDKVLIRTYDHTGMAAVIEYPLSGVSASPE